MEGDRTEERRVTDWDINSNREMRKNMGAKQHRENAALGEEGQLKLRNHKEK